MMAWYWFIGASSDGGEGEWQWCLFFMDTHRWPGGVIG